MCSRHQTGQIAWSWPRRIIIKRVGHTECTLGFCGTTIDAAEKLGRDWIGIDVTQLAISLIKNRLQDNYGSRLKTWMRRFNGVATKYLDSYLGWHRINDREGRTLDASRMLAAAWG